MSRIQAISQASSEASNLAVDVPAVMPETFMPSAMAGSSFASDLRSILKTREQLAGFVRRLDDFLTGLVIGPSGGPLLRETLETAIRHYYSAGQTSKHTDAARFMSACVAVAANGLSGYKIMVIGAGGAVEWRPHEHQSIRNLIAKISATQVRFDLRKPADQAEWRAMRIVVGQNICQFEDIVTMERVDIDYRLYDLN